MAFGINLPVAFLAKEKNVWKNEFRLTPRRLKLAILFLMIYGVATVAVQVIFLHGYFALESNILSGSAVPLVFEAMPLGICIPFGRRDR